MIKKLAFVFLLFLTYSGFSQELEADSLLQSLSISEEPQSLLPERMLITQRMLWGQNGLYRKIGIAPKVLTNETRAKELKIRRTMFRIHQAMGLATAAAMVAQGLVGAKLYTNYSDKTKQLHEGLATGLNIGYATTALMAFTSPPPFINRKKFDNIKLHKYLSYIHLTGMISTNVLAGKINEKPSLKPVHRAAAYTTFGAYMLAIATIKFEF